MAAVTRGVAASGDALRLRAIDELALVDQTPANLTGTHVCFLSVLHWAHDAAQVSLTGFRFADTADLTAGVTTNTSSVSILRCDEGWAAGA